jgi:hypothetical protein
VVSEGYVVLVGRGYATRMLPNLPIEGCERPEACQRIQHQGLDAPNRKNVHHTCIVLVGINAGQYMWQRVSDQLLQLYLSGRKFPCCVMSKSGAGTEAESSITYLVNAPLT